MLTITADAAEAIRTALKAPELPDSAGLRISTLSTALNGRGPTIAVHVAPAPQADDEILLSEGAQVFVAPEAVAILEDKLLDVYSDPGGKLRFSLIDRN